MGHQPVELRQARICVLRASITAITRRQVRSPAALRRSTTPRPSVALASLCTRPRSTSDCALRLVWPLFRLAACASSFTDSGANAPIAARQRPSPSAMPGSFR